MAFSMLSSNLLSLIFCHLLISEALGATVCSSAPYKDLLFLSSYAPAESYCSAHYPLPTVTVTATAAAAKLRGRSVSTTTTTKAASKTTSKTTSKNTSKTTTKTTTKTTSTTTTAKATGTDAIWSSLISSAKAIISTICSCIETPPTKTVTAPPKATATACNPGGAQPTFILLASGSGTIDDGRYALLANTGDTDPVTFAPNVTAATPFTFNSACNLVGYNGEIANTDAGSTQETLFFNTAAQIAAGGYVPITCNIANDALSCVAQTATILYVCPNLLQLQIATTVPDGCSAVKLTAIYQ